MQQNPNESPMTHNDAPNLYLFLYLWIVYSLYTYVYVSTAPIRYSLKQLDGCVVKLLDCLTGVEHRINFNLLITVLLYCISTGSSRRNLLSQNIPKLPKAYQRASVRSTTDCRLQITCWQALHHSAPASANGFGKFKQTIFQLLSNPVKPFQI